MTCFCSKWCLFGSPW